MAGTPIRTLVALRYRLMWAQARTSAGRIAVFVVLYVLGALAFAFLALGGFGAAVAGVQGGHGQQVVAAVLGGLFAAAIPSTLFLSVGPNKAFSDRVMRRYPLGARRRFLARHFIGLLDPIWLLFLGTLLGLAAGLQLVGACSLVVGLPGVLAFLAVIYLLIAVVVSLVGKVVETRTGPLVLMITVMTIYLLFIFGAPLAAEQGVHLLPIGLAVLRFTPAAAAAHFLVGAGVLERMAGGAMLVAWGSAGAAALAAVERIHWERRQQAADSVTGASWYDTVGDWFSPPVGPLVAKALRYHLRCNRVRYSMLFSGPVFVAVLWLQRLRPAERTFGLLMELFVLGFLATFALSVNYFGWDGPGVRRYQLVPSGAEAALRANSYAGLMLGALVSLVVLGFVIGTSALPVDGRLLGFAVSAAIAGLLWLHSAGMWLSVLAPKLTDFDSMMSGNVSRAASLLMLAIIVPLFVTVKLWFARPAELLTYWWIVALVALAGLAFYRLSLRAAGRALERRWERMVGDMAAKSGNFAAAG